MGIVPDEGNGQHDNAIWWSVVAFTVLYGWEQQEKGTLSDKVYGSATTEACHLNTVLIHEHGVVSHAPCLDPGLQAHDRHFDFG